MRLLNISSLEFQYFGDNDRPPYAIASHRWGADETTFKDFLHKPDVFSPGYTKVLGFRQLVHRMNSLVGPSRALDDLGLRHRCEWLWIDTCCINKEDGAELSESINSMFRWYGDAAVCYAYLADVKPSQKFRSTTLDLTRSQWFKRGWTLQELIAPRNVVFLATSWDVLGHKCAYSEQVCATVCQGYGSRLNKLIAQITSIPLEVIGMSHIDQLRNIGIEQKMSWAQRRITTRTEDQAYCLLGLLDVFISPIYGEGDNAWTRLLQQLEYKQTMQRSPVLGGKTSKKSHMWFRLKGVKKEIVKKGHFASQTTCTAELSGYSTMSAQLPEGSTQSYSSAPLSLPGLPAPDHRAQSENTFPKVPMSVPPQETHEFYFYSPRPPMSVPPPQSYRSYSYEASSVQYSKTPGPNRGRGGRPAYEERTASIRRKAIPVTKQPVQRGIAAALEACVNRIAEDPSLLPPDATLKHRYGSAWSFHNADGYNSVWYHELPAVELSKVKLASGEDEGFGMAHKVIAHSDFRPSAPGGLAFDKGDVIIVLESLHKDWWKGRLHGRTGIFPQAYVEKLQNFTQNEQSETKKQSNANISTLAAGEEPGLEDWIRLDARTPGAFTDLQSQLIINSVCSATSEEHYSSSKSRVSPAEVSDEITDSAGPSRSTVKSPVRRKLVRRATGPPKKHVDHQEDECQEQEVADSTNLVPELTGQQLNALSNPLRQAFTSYVQTNQIETRLSAHTYPPSPPKTLLTGFKEHTAEPIGFIESDNSVREDDESSIQSEHFETASWRQSSEMMPPQKASNTEVQVEMWPETGAHFQTGYEQREAVLVQSSVVAESEETAMITIPKMVLRALLDPAAVNETVTSDQAALLASTAVGYIRTLLLSESATRLQPVQQSTAVEAYRLETSEFQHTSVAETLSTTTGDSSSHDGCDDVDVARRRSNRQSWFLHGVWADRT